MIPIIATILFYGCYDYTDPFFAGAARDNRRPPTAIRQAFPAAAIRCGHAFISSRADYG